MCVCVCIYISIIILNRKQLASSILSMYDRGRRLFNDFIVTEFFYPIFYLEQHHMHEIPMKICIWIDRLCQLTYGHQRKVRGYLRVIGFLLNIELKCLFEIISDRFSPYMTRKIQWFLLFQTMVKYFKLCGYLEHLPPSSNPIFK